MSTPIESLPMTDFCAYCDTPIREDSAGVWVDATDGDCCWGDPETGDNENEPHVAVKR